MLIDTHCHLASFHARGDMPAVLDRAAAVGVGRVITIGTGVDDWDLYASLAAQHPGRVDYTVGLHPCDVPADDSWKDMVKKLPAYFERKNSTPPVALGEIGLDRFHLPKEPAQAEEIYARQREAFHMQLAVAKALDCPVVIHSRESFADCVAMIDASGVDWRKIVFHCFAHGAAELRPLAERGGRASFTGIITYKNAAPVREALTAQGLDTLMLETDAPYLAPMPHRGQPNEPAYLAHTAREAARILNVAFEELAVRTTANAVTFFSLK